MTQTAFCFTTAPFVLLTLPSSLLVWSRVYFYCILGTAASMAFFASPGKSWLIHQLKIQNAATGAEKEVLKAQGHGHGRPDLGGRRTTNTSALDGYGGLGLPDDPEREVQEAVAEIKSEVEGRRRRGSKITVPTGEELKQMVEERLGKKLS